MDGICNHFFTFKIKFNYSDSENKTDAMINSPMGPGDKMIVSGDLEGFCNMVSSIWTIGGKIYRSICDY